jgi:hypothetical protein
MFNHIISEVLHGTRFCCPVLAAGRGGGGGETGCSTSGWVGSAIGGSGFVVPARVAGRAAGGGQRLGWVLHGGERGRRWGAQLA